ncbi:MAG: hypothetical protein JST91_22090 [Actinobacteria bacterium]|nr:hypothetical protein [Actinomycetota bacterium]
MSTFKRYLRLQAMTFAFGAVGPIFLVIYFVAQPDPTIKWMYWWGLVITTVDVLAALAMTGDATPAGAAEPAE